MTFSGHTRKLFSDIMKFRCPGVSVCLLLLLAACTDSDGGASQAIPRPKAWPRLNIATSDSMTAVPGMPVEVLVNPTALWEVQETDPPGLTVTYPEVNTRIFYTFIKAGGEARNNDIIERRQQRISLNLNGAPAETVHSLPNESTGASGVIVEATSAASTPVQLLARLPGWIVSATAFIDSDNPTLNYDSIRPVVKALRHDMARTLPALAFPESSADQR